MEVLDHADVCVGVAFPLCSCFFGERANWANTTNLFWYPLFFRSVITCLVGSVGRGWLLIRICVITCFSYAILATRISFNLNL